MTSKRTVEEKKQLALETARNFLPEPDQIPPIGDARCQADAYEIATAIAALKTLAIEYIAAYPDSARIDGVNAGLSLISALLEVSDHPVFDFVDGIRAIAAARPPKRALQKAIRAAAVISVRALVNADDMTAKDARNEIAKRLQAIPEFKGLKGETIRKWDERLGDKELAAIRPLVAFVLRETEREPSKILDRLVAGVERALAAPPTVLRNGQRPPLLSNS